MIAFPTAKVNLGLNVVERRPDGYHNLETVFLPVGLTDAIELLPMHPQFPSAEDGAAAGCSLSIMNIPVEGDTRNNLVVRAYAMLKADFPRQVGRVHAHLFKAIPTQAGMGGGSSDGACMLKMLNELFQLRLSQQQLIGYATRLGADCPFFILGTPAYAEGIGERLQPIDLDLSDYRIAVVKPPIPVSTKEAFALVKPRRPQKNCRDIVMQPVETWRDELVNDFEPSVFAQYPAIAAVKQRLYDLGATYASMSGSGSAVFALFSKTATPPHFTLSGEPAFQGMFTAVLTA